MENRTVRTFISLDTAVVSQRFFSTVKDNIIIPNEVSNFLLIDLLLGSLVDIHHHKMLISIEEIWAEQTIDYRVQSIG